jgi:hypothetical protein
MKKKIFTDEKFIKVVESVVGKLEKERGLLFHKRIAYFAGMQTR